MLHLAWQESVGLNRFNLKITVLRKTTIFSILEMRPGKVLASVSSAIIKRPSNTLRNSI